MVSGSGYVYSDEYGQRRVSASSWTRGRARQLSAGCVRAISLVQCCCWDDSFFSPVGFIHSGYAVAPGMKQQSAWSAQTLGKVSAGPCGYTLWALVCRGWSLCWRWVPVTAAHRGAAQPCTPAQVGGTSGDELLHPCFAKAGPTSILAQVSQNLSIRVLCRNLPNPEGLCEAVVARVQPAGCRKGSSPSTWHWWEVRWRTESGFVFLSPRKTLTFWRKSNGGSIRVVRGWSKRCRRRGWGSWFISAWGRDGWREVSLLSAATYWEAVEKTNPDSYRRRALKGQKATDATWKTGNSS